MLHFLNCTTLPCCKKVFPDLGSQFYLRWCPVRHGTLGRDGSSSASRPARPGPVAAPKQFSWSGRDTETRANQYKVTDYSESSHTEQCTLVNTMRQTDSHFYYYSFLSKCTVKIFLRKFTEIIGIFFCGPPLRC